MRIFCWVAFRIVYVLFLYILVTFLGLPYGLFEFRIAFGLSALDTFALCHVRLKGIVDNHTHLKYVHVHVDPGIYTLPMWQSKCVSVRVGMGMMKKREKKGYQTRVLVKQRERIMKKKIPVIQSNVRLLLFDIFDSIHGTEIHRSVNIHFHFIEIDVNLLWNWP